MEENKRFLIAIDLDDTVLSSLFSLCARSVEALIDAKQAGHRVMIATARPTAMALPYYRLLGLDTPLSVLNGARCTTRGIRPFLRKTIGCPRRKRPLRAAFL